MRVLKSFVGFASVLVASACATAPSAPPPPPVSAAHQPEPVLIPEVRVDERIELIAIIFRLAGAEEYSTRYVPRYAKAIDDYFAPYCDHPAVLAVKELRSRDSVAANAIPDLAVQLGPLPGLQERVPLEQAEIDPRWKVPAARDFLAKARDFAAQSKFDQFLASQRPFYAVAERRLHNLIRDEADLRWIQQFYGGTGAEKFVAVPAPGNGHIFYGVRYFGPNGEREFYAVMTVMQVDEDGMPYFRLADAPLLIHEFGHSYVTPLILKHYEADLADVGKLLLETGGDEMKGQGYGLGSTIIHESIIRAGVARYKLAHGGPDAARLELERQRQLGFLWIDELYDLLGRYERQRDTYADIAAFYPELRAYFRSLGKRLPALVAARDAQRPAIVSTSPAEGATVDPSTDTLVVRFDRKMEQNWGWQPTRSGMGQWPNISNVRMNADRTVLTASISLAPNTAYQATFLTSQFSSADGVPLKPFTLKFRTGPDKKRRR